MSFRGRDDSSGGNTKVELGEPRRFGGMEDKSESDDRPSRFDSSRGRRPPFGRGDGRGRRPSPGRDKPFGERPRDFMYGRNESDFMPSGGRHLMRDRSPVHGVDDRFSDRFKKNDRRDDLSRKDSGRPFFEDSHRDRFMGMEGRPRLDGAGNFGSRFDGPNDPLKLRPMNPQGAPPKEFFQGFPKPNECEIIAMNKQQRAYAESVEARIKSLGILVDILFLKDEALLTQTIDDIARRGSLFAIIISSQNETHRSVTVNILHGKPQEHRNMPLEDALKLVSRNFHEHIVTQKEQMERERAERGPYTGVVSADQEIQFLLRMLADGRWISLAEINAVILYLCERRDKMQGAVGDERVRPRLPAPSADVKIEPPYKPKDDADVAQKEQDLQNRIINLMSQGAPSAAKAVNAQSVGMNQGALPTSNVSPNRSNQPQMSPGMHPGMGSNIPGIQSVRPGLDESIPSQTKIDSNLPVPESTNTGFNAGISSSAKTDPSTTATYINFDNPSVQKALDNLMQSGPNLLKNISLTSSTMSTLPPSNMPPKTTANTGSSISARNENAGLTSGGGSVGPRGNLGPRGMSDVGGNAPGRNQANIDMPPPRSNINLPNMSGPPPQRGGTGSDMGSQNYGGLSDMRGRHENLGQRFGNTGMGNQGMGPQRMPGNISDMNRMGQQRGNVLPQDMQRPPPGMSQGGNFPGQNQFNKYPGNQPGNFSGTSFNAGNLGGMPRQNYGSIGGPQGMGNMGTGPRRY